jgi:ubiquinone biosynthesis protein
LEQEPAEEAGLGGRLMIRLAVVEIAFYRALIESGLNVRDASELVAAAAWIAYEKMACFPMLVGRLTARTAAQRLRRAIDVFRFFPFGPPAYRMEDLSVDPPTVAFDVLRCPVAECFLANGLSQLCVKAFCDLDYPLAAKWGAVLERKGTLAGGAKACDFRWTPASASAAAREGSPKWQRQ